MLRWKSRPVGILGVPIAAPESTNRAVAALAPTWARGVQHLQHQGFYTVSCLGNLGLAFQRSVKIDFLAD